MPVVLEQRPDVLLEPNIVPQPGPQYDFMDCKADIAIYGGSAGGGKSWALLAEALRYKDNPEFGAVIFRRTVPQITNEGALWDESRKMYPGVGGVPNQVNLRWKFPSGAKVTFSHLQYESDVHNWQGSQVPLMCFDELTHFTRKQFEYLVFSRGRSTCGIRSYVRCSCNPDPDSWVKQFIAWWIDPDTGLAIPTRSGVVRWMVRRGDTMVWFGAKGDALAYLAGLGDTETRPTSVTFIRSSIYDNKVLLKADPGYLSRLNALDAVTRAQLKDGNWNARPVSGIFRPADLDKHRVTSTPRLGLVAVGVDPTGGSEVENDEAGIVVAGRDSQSPPHYYVLEDLSLSQATPQRWGAQAVTGYNKHRADVIVAEDNYGGEMVESTIKVVDKNVPVRRVHASRGKRVRAEPMAVLATQGRLHMVGAFPELEREMCNWDPDTGDSPNRMDALVWAVKDLMDQPEVGNGIDPSFFKHSPLRV